MQVGEVVARFKADISDFQAGMKRVQSGMKSTASKLKKGGESVRNVGAQMTAATAPIIGFGALTIKSAGNFEAAMKDVQGITGATGNDLEEMSDLAKELGRTTMFSASEAADGMKFLGMAGFDTKQILEAMPGVLNLAAAESIDLGRAADIASNIMGQFQLEANQSERVVNLLSATASQSNTDVLQLSEAFKYIGPTANALNMDIEETATIIGILGDAGIQGSLAGRALGTSLVRLTKPTNKMQGAINDLGVEFFDAEGQFIGVHEMVRRLNTATADLTDEQRAAAISTIFGMEAYQEMNILLNRGAEGYGELQSKISGTEKATEKAELKMEGWNGAVKALKSAVEGLMIAIGESGLLEDLAGLITKITEFVRGLSETNPVILKIVAAIAGLLVIIGPLLIIFGQIAIAIGAIIPVFTAIVSAIASFATFIVATAIPAIIGFVAAFWPLILIAGVVGGAAYMLWKHWDTVVAFFQAAPAKIGQFVDAVGAWFQQLPERADNALRALAEAFVIGFGFLLGIIVYWIPHIVYQIAKFLWEAPLKAAEALAGLYQAFVNWAADTWAFLKSEIPRQFDNLISWMIKLPFRAYAALIRLRKSMSNAAEEGWQGMLNEISQWPSRLFEWGVNMVKSFVEGFANLGKWLGDQIKAGMDAAKGMIEGQSPPKEGPFKNIDKWGMNVASAWVEGFGDVFGTMDLGNLSQAQAMAAPASNTTITQNNTINRPFDYDSALSELGWKMRTGV
jgi:TP901 family phage tail tape measure protein